MFYYKLVEDNFDGSAECVIVASNIKYSFKEFQELVFEVMMPKETDEDYIDEHTYRNIYQIGEVLVYEYGFSYVNCEVRLVV